jgi:predicted RNA methylase
LKKYIDYFNYFIYLAINWNPRLAFFILSHEMKGEKFYGIETTKPDSLKQLTIKSDNKYEAEIYMPSNYYILEVLFTHLPKIENRGSFVDLGCGKGRVLAVAAHHGFNRLRGIEFAEELCLEAAKNMHKVESRFPDLKWEVVCKDVIESSICEDDTVFFFFNPFGENVMRQVLHLIMESLRMHPRKVYVMYCNPRFKDLFFQRGFTEIYSHKKLKIIDAVILTRQ